MFYLNDFTIPLKASCPASVQEHVGRAFQGVHLVLFDGEIFHELSFSLFKAIVFANKVPGVMYEC